MKHLKAGLAFAAALSLISSAVPAKAEPLKNIVLVHGAWVDASGWKPVYDILTKEGFHVSMVQEPETSFADDVTAANRVAFPGSGRRAGLQHAADRGRVEDKTELGDRRRRRPHHQPRS
jgi:hypothetical protein